MPVSGVPPFLKRPYGPQCHLRVYAFFQRNQPLIETAHEHFIGAKPALKRHCPFAELAQQRGPDFLNSFEQLRAFRIESGLQIGFCDEFICHVCILTPS